MFGELILFFIQNIFDAVIVIQLVLVFKDTVFYGVSSKCLMLPIAHNTPYSGDICS